MDQVNIGDVARGMGLDPRIGPDYLGPGIGFGGSCLPKDLTALISESRSIGFEPALLRAVLTINRKQPNRAVEIAKEHLRTMSGRRVAVLGLTFKPNTDDLRESPSMKIVSALLREGCKVAVFDPKGLKEAERILRARVTYTSDPYSCVRDTDCCFICTPWKQLKALDLRKVARLMRTPLIVDGRRLYAEDEVAPEITYRTIGRKFARDHPI